MPKNPSIKFKAIVQQDDQTTACGITLPFDPEKVFGKIRVPVKVTINNHTYRTTTARMAGCDWFVVNKENRTAANIKAGDKVEVIMELDTEPRIIEPPADFLKALKGNKKAFEKWEKLSYSHKKEHVRAIEESKKPETRARRIAKALEMLSEG